MTPEQDKKNCSSSAGKRPPTCYCCGGPHFAPQCKFKDTICRYCKKKGHLAQVCNAISRKSYPSSTPKTPQGEPKINLVEDQDVGKEIVDNSYSIFSILSSF